MGAIESIIDGEEHDDFLRKLECMKTHHSFSGTFSKGPTEEYFDCVLMKEHERKMFEGKIKEMSEDELVSLMSIDMDEALNLFSPTPNQ